MNWYYALNGQQKGPVSEQDIMQLVSSGTINASTLIWRDGLADWQPVSTALPAALDTAPANVPQIGGFAVPAAQKDLYVQQLREGVSPSLPGSMEYAGFWIRVGAKIIDNLIFIFSLLFVMAVLGMIMHFAGLQVVPEDTKDNPGAPPPIGFIILVGIYYIGAFFGPPVYNAIFIAKSGATPGKSACGLKVVNEDGSPVTKGRAWGRGFAEIISGMTCSIGYVIAGFDDHKRALHDHICATRVIKTR
jgi:uncharacterized RDD family membrane protein YckC